MYNKEELERLIINENKSYEEIGRLLNVSGSAVKKAAKKMGIKLPNRRKVNEKETFNRGKKLTYETRFCERCGKEIKHGRYSRFCSSECFQKYMKEKRVNEWKKNPELFSKEEIPSFIRKYLFEKYDGKCSNPECGWHEVNPYTGEVPLEVHHIDGDCTNNKEENLVLLCPNCHSLTNNHGSLNRGNSRRYKLKKYKDSIKNL